MEGEPRQDRSAIIPPTKVDANGQPVAALRIISNLNNLTFDSNNGVVEVQLEPGAYIVYLSPNERKLIVNAIGFLRLDLTLNELGIVLKSGDVWELTVTGELQEQKVAINFLLTPEPAKVQLFLNGQR
ncbi:hypothetical protein RZS08_25240, partial [Arthrospira platensis SPKY1]|nr:hypothetical protein [Arthrospira platensis SPKY1]